MNPKFPLNKSDKEAIGKNPPSTSQPESKLPIWVYIIFRRNPSSGHEKLSIKESSDGPIFWTRKVIYLFCCSCHFDKHELKRRIFKQEVIRVLEKGKSMIERVCMVDAPLDYAFLPDSIFNYLANCLPKLEFIYLRELDLEKINRATVERLSKHKNLKKLIVHGCRSYEVLQDFHYLPQLLVVKGDIIGLKAMLGDAFDEKLLMGEDYNRIRSSSESVQTNGNLRATSLSSTSAANGL